MKRDPKILEELQAIAPGLAEVAVDQPHSVPDGYFDVLPSVILSRIREEQDVPTGYFDGLASRIMGRINQDELLTSAPTLAGMDRKMPQSVPSGYFEGLAGKLADKQRKPAKVISISFTRVVRYAAAAVVAGLLFTGAWYMIRDDRSLTGTGTYAANGTPDSLPETALASYLDQTSSLDGLEPDMGENVKTDDMALLNLDDQKLGEMLTTMTDKELADYVSNDPNGGPNVMKN